MSGPKPAGPVETVVSREKTEGGFEFLYEKDVAVEMSDGLSLRANVFRPAADGQYPVIMSHGVYGKDVHFSQAFSAQWKRLLEIHPGLCKDGSTGRFLHWEIPDPERWLPDGYVMISVDGRGSGKSPGYLDPRSARENQDFYELIEWAAQQSWSNGKVGLLGISYLAINQWSVASLRPPHLAAICPWEGFWDNYRDNTHHGGIFSNTFTYNWWPRQVLVNQYGNGKTPHVDPDTGTCTTGPALSEQMLAENRSEYPRDHGRRKLADEWYKDRTADLSRVEVPLLSAGNWSGPGVHLRGNIAGFVEAASQQKWLSMHIGTHFESFYLPEYIALQKRFFDHFLKGEDNGWDREPPVRIAVRKVDGTADIRTENDWPLARTQWTKFHLDAAGGDLLATPPAGEAQADYLALQQGVTFITAPFEKETEITGYVAARLVVSSSTTDMDIFAVLRAFDPDGNEVTFEGAHERTPVSRGWLRVSHRKLDPARSLPYRPYLAHDEIQKIEPSRTYAVDLEIWPTCIVLPKGYALALTLQGHDFELPGIPGRILHNDPDDRPAAEYGGVNSIHTGGAEECFLLVPIIPPTT